MLLPVLILVYFSFSITSFAILGNVFKSVRFNLPLSSSSGVHTFPSCSLVPLSVPYSFLNFFLFALHLLFNLFLRLFYSPDLLSLSLCSSISFAFSLLCKSAAAQPECQPRSLSPWHSQQRPWRGSCPPRRSTCSWAAGWRSRARWRGARRPPSSPGPGRASPCSRPTPATTTWPTGMRRRPSRASRWHARTPRPETRARTAARPSARRPST